MTTFVEKPQQIEATQFEGGFDSARDVIEWLYVRGASASYVPEILNDGNAVVDEHVLVSVGSRAKTHIRLDKDLWIVDDPRQDGYYMSTTRRLLGHYEQADE